MRPVSGTLEALTVTASGSPTIRRESRNKQTKISSLSCCCCRRQATRRRSCCCCLWPGGERVKRHSRCLLLLLLACCLLAACLLACGDGCCCCCPFTRADQWRLGWYHTEYTATRQGKQGKESKRASPRGCKVERSRTDRRTRRRRRGGAAGAGLQAANVRGCPGGSGSLGGGHSGLARWRCSGGCSCPSLDQAEYAQVGSEQATSPSSVACARVRLHCCCCCLRCGRSRRCSTPQRERRKYVEEAAPGDGAPSTAGWPPPKCRGKRGTR